MELDRARWLVSPEGRLALEGAAGNTSAREPNRLASELRRTFPAAEAGALAEQLTLRERAIRNHGTHRDFLFTADGLEMMTHPAVAERRAIRLAASERLVVDLTVGIGGDLYAIARQAVSCAGLDRDPVHALLAAANTGVPVARGDAEHPPFDVAGLAVVIDPSRRSGDLRRFNPASFAPRWDEAIAVATSAATAVMKAPPGIDASYIPPGVEVEAIQLGRSMREMSIWFGQGAQPGLRRGVLLPEGETIDSDEAAAPEKPGPPGLFLFDPESCVTRATLVRQLGHRLGAWLMDPHVAYLSAEEPAFSPLAATFEVLEAVPFSVSRLKQRLREMKWRPDEIRRRAFPLEPDELRRLLGRLDGEAVCLVCTTLGRERMVFVCRRLFAPA
jgi:hypothetical protein